MIPVPGSTYGFEWKKGSVITGVCIRAKNGWAVFRTSKTTFTVPFSDVKVKFK